MRRIRAELRRAMDQRLGFRLHVLERRAVQRQAVEQRLGQARERGRIGGVGLERAAEILRRLQVVIGSAQPLAFTRQQIKFETIGGVCAAFRPLLRGVG
jgi:hypothetical protein